eukprot:6052483-Prymnesium_polylepis.1
MVTCRRPSMALQLATDFSTASCTSAAQRVGRPRQPQCTRATSRCWCGASSPAFSARSRRTTRSCARAA